MNSRADVEVHGRVRVREFGFTIKLEFDFEFEGAPEDVGMVTGATIHTANQLRMRVKRRKK